MTAAAPIAKEQLTGLCGHCLTKPVTIICEKCGIMRYCGLACKKKDFVEKHQHLCTSITCKETAQGFLRMCMKKIVGPYYEGFIILHLNRLVNYLTPQEILELTDTTRNGHIQFGIKMAIGATVD